MKSARKRFTLDLEPTFQRRLKVIAAVKGVSMRNYCVELIERQLAVDEADEGLKYPLGSIISRKFSLEGGLMEELDRRSDTAIGR